MKVTTYGTRGSIPIANQNSVRFGGNTTCLRIESSALPKGHALVIDAGSGIVPLGKKLTEEKSEKVTLLWTHYHHDHTQGLLLSPILFNPTVRKYCYGPVENGVGPQEMMEQMMQHPFFPVTFSEVSNSFICKKLETPNAMAFIIHREGGTKLCKIDELRSYEARSPAQVMMGSGRYPLSECLVVKMLYSNHPERTISYRFEERETGKVFVFLTDHENTAWLSNILQAHLDQADLLIMDSQYLPTTYEKFSAGFGHGTPTYCVTTANTVGAKKIGLTHHDPGSTDDQVDGITAVGRETAEQLGYAGDVFACADYMEIEV
jgi:phosphoribosyl 1,2-cyclic phosphodiesterase